MEPGAAKLGALLKRRRDEKNLTLENVQALTRKYGASVSIGFLSDVERGYPREGGTLTIPKDDKLSALARALDLPLRDLHAALGRVPDGTPAVQLVREKAAAYGDGEDLHPDVLADLSSEVEDFAAVRVRRQMQRQGRQLQVQG